VDSPSVNQTARIGTNALPESTSTKTKRRKGTGVRGYQSIPDAHYFGGIFNDDDVVALATTFNRARQAAQSGADDDDVDPRGFTDEGVAFCFGHCREKVDRGELRGWRGGGRERMFR